MLSREHLKEIAVRIGFDAVGVAPAALLCDEVARLRQWVDEGKNAGMGYMAAHTALRENPALLVEDARSVIVTLTNYYHPSVQPPGVPRIARYAWGKDYHLVVKERLRKLLASLSGEEKIGGRCFTDSAPVMEHEWARRAGLGWQGRNTLLVSRDLGSFCFIGIIITTGAFDSYDEPFSEEYCGNCNRCVEACPTGALTPYEVDACRCISYQTIENRDEYPEELKRLAGGRVFGCDACQDVCPWNSRAQTHQVKEFLPRNGVLELGAEDWRTMDEARFMELFRDSPLRRAGLSGIVRNLD